MVCESVALGSHVICSKRVSVVSSLVAYLLATTFVHALHDHSTGGHCCGESHACAALGATHAECDPADSEGCHRPGGDSANASHGSAHHDAPSRPDDRESSCFACRFLAAKSIAPVAVAVVEWNEALHQAEPRQHIFAPVVRPELPFSRGPPRA
jgi:hypothetical protein